MDELAAAIRESRLDHGRSADELARQASVPLEATRSIECGDDHADVAHVVALLDVLGIEFSAIPATAPIREYPGVDLDAVIARHA